MVLTKVIADKPVESQLIIFTNFVSRLMGPQHRFINDYHNDLYHRDRVMTAVDIPETEQALRDHTPETSHQLVNRVANRLSTWKVASPLEANVTDHHTSDDDQNLFDVLYNLGQRYGIDTKRQLKWYGPKRGESIIRPGEVKERGEIGRRLRSP